MASCTGDMEDGSVAEPEAPSGTDQACAIGLSDASEPPPPLGLMTSLPIYWPLGADLSDLASGGEAHTWQRAAIERCFTLVPLDTLSAIPALSPTDADIDPLAGLERMAVIQPRGLSPQDNVALDDWVRDGGDLLIALDPALTGEYDLALGDPRLPTMSALIPPVIERWGLGVSFDEGQELTVIEEDLGYAQIPLALPGFLATTSDNCTLAAQGAVAKCAIGKGQVTVIADAALFEHQELVGENGATLASLFDYAFN
ncbi:MAG: hypothetical protein AAGL68_12280 [Pseudomonadota bacterium]